MVEYRSVALILLDFQYIEQALRVYITCSNMIIKKKLLGIMPYRYGYDFIENDSLGKLLEKFEKVSDNVDLVKKLKKLVPERNRIAHRSLLWTREQLMSKDFIAANVKNWEKLHTQIKKVYEVLCQEIKNLEKNLEKL